MLCDSVSATDFYNVGLGGPPETLAERFPKFRVYQNCRLGIGGAAPSEPFCDLNCFLRNDAHFTDVQLLRMFFFAVGAP